jgi:hypothetical protein
MSIDADVLSAGVARLLSAGHFRRYTLLCALARSPLPQLARLKSGVRDRAMCWPRA